MAYSAEESRRLHQDWWGKCRTCLYWKGTDESRMAAGVCDNPKSDMHGKETWTDGHCRKWDSYDICVALEMLQESEKLKEEQVAHHGRVTG